MGRWYFLIFLSLLTICSAKAQPYNGHVVDAFSGDSLANVNVANNYRNTGTFTTTQGWFSVRAYPYDSLRFSLVGYQPQTIRADQLPEQIAMIPDTVLLPGVRVLANWIEMRWDTSAAPVRLPGVPFVENPKRAKPMTWTWGGNNPSEGGLPTVGIGGSLSGPISYFMGYEKDQRKYERIRREAEAQRSYRQVVSDPETREQLTKSFQLTDEQYDSLIIIFNQNHLALTERVDSEEVKSTLWWFFSQAVAN